MPRFAQSARRRRQKRHSYHKRVATAEGRRLWNDYCAAKMARRRELQRQAEEGNTLELHQAHLSIVSNLRSPLLKYIDARGKVWTEVELSAEELIRRYERKRKDGHHP